MDCISLNIKDLYKGYLKLKGKEQGQGFKNAGRKNYNF